MLESRGCWLCARKKVECAHNCQTFPFIHTKNSSKFSLKFCHSIIIFSLSLEYNRALELWAFWKLSTQWEILDWKCLIHEVYDSSWGHKNLSCHFLPLSNFLSSVFINMLSDVVHHSSKISFNLWRHLHDVFFFLFCHFLLFPILFYTETPQREFEKEKKCEVIYSRLWLNLNL